jgi:hypothetical protein
MKMRKESEEERKKLSLSGFEFDTGGRQIEETCFNASRN